MKQFFRRLWALALCALLLAGGTGAFAEAISVDGGIDEAWLEADPVSGPEAYDLALDGALPETPVEPARSNAAAGEADGFAYTVLADGTASITDCSLAGDVVIPETVDGYTVTNLRAQLFFGRDDVTSVTVPATVTYFGEDPSDSAFTYVFSYCDSLTAIRVRSGNPSFRSVDGVLYSRDMKLLYNYPCNRPGAEYRVPAATEVLDCTSFAGARNLTGLYLESAETTWRTYTFALDGALTVYYLTGGFAQYTAEDHVARGLSRDADESYPTFRAIQAPEAVTLNKADTVTLAMGNTLKLKAKVAPEGVETRLTWKSSRKTVATVDSKGVVTPKKAGTATVTVTTGNGKSASVTVKVVDARSVKLKRGDATLKTGQVLNLKRGKSLTLKAVVSPARVKTALKWGCSDKTGAVTVKDGRVTAKKTAKAGARVKVAVKTANGVSTYVYIKVK